MTDSSAETVSAIITAAVVGVQALVMVRRADRMRAKAREIERLLSTSAAVEPDPEPPTTGMPWRLRWFGWRLTVGGLLGLPLPKSADRP